LRYAQAPIAKNAASRTYFGWSVTSGSLSG
jgi:hypothetical protein